jgi:hypothetical protein
MLLRQDPVHEATYRRLMRLHSRGGERARALRVYHTCATVLERELGVEPGPLTRQAYADLVSLESAPVPALPVPEAGFTAAPLVGRQAEFERSVAAWTEASGGRSQLLLVIGEAGLGKTRLVEELELRCARQGITTARTRAYAAEGRLAYAPVVGWLRSAALRPGLTKLEPVWLTEIARLLPELLSEHPDLPRPEPMTGAEQRQHLFEALARGLLGGAQPLLLVVDDLQWCDQETIEFLHYLVRFDPRAPLLVAATARPEEISPQHAATALVAGLRGIERMVEIVLGPLDPAQVTELAEQLGEAPLEAGVAERLYRETEGNPLFLVETVRAGLLTGALPPKVQSVLQARLAQLSPAAAELVALAATVGREFTYDVLAQSSGHDEDTLVTGLDELWRRRIVREHGLNAYDFSHDKLREGIALIGDGVARTSAPGRTIFRTYCLSLLARAHGLAGQPGVALDVLGRRWRRPNGPGSGTSRRNCSACGPRCSWPKVERKPRPRPRRRCATPSTSPTTRGPSFSSCGLPSPWPVGGPSRGRRRRRPKRFGSSNRSRANSPKSPTPLIWPRRGNCCSHRPDRRHR